VLAAWIVLLTGIFAAYDSNYLRAFQNTAISILIFGVWYGLRRFSKKYQKAQNNKNFDRIAYQVKYWRSADALNAKYIYRDCLGPDCRATFNLLTGEKWHDK